MLECYFSPAGDCRLKGLRGPSYLSLSVVLSCGLCRDRGPNYQQRLQHLKQNTTHTKMMWIRKTEVLKHLWLQPQNDIYVVASAVAVAELWMHTNYYFITLPQSAFSYLSPSCLFWQCSGPCLDHSTLPPVRLKRKVKVYYHPVGYFSRSTSQLSLTCLGSELKLQSYLWATTSVHPSLIPAAPLNSHPPDQWKWYWKANQNEGNMKCVKKVRFRKELLEQF